MEAEETSMWTVCELQRVNDSDAGLCLPNGPQSSVSQRHDDEAAPILWSHRQTVHFAARLHLTSAALKSAQAF